MNYSEAIAYRNTFLILTFILTLSIIRPVFYDKNEKIKIQTSPEKVFGIDVSHHQGTIDWQKISEQKQVKFAYVKATEGTYFVDPRNQNNSKSLKQLRIPFGNYHFFHPNESASLQANFFLSHIPKYPILPPVLDIEILQSSTPEALQKKLKIWLEIVEEKTNCTPIIYTDLDFWKENIGPNFSKYRLWIAGYNSRLILPKDLPKWSIWQKTERKKLNGINGNIDLNELNVPTTSIGDLSC